MFTEVLYLKQRYKYSHIYFPNCRIVIFKDKLKLILKLKSNILIHGFISLSVVYYK
jgi:hypothetical protein